MSILHITALVGAVKYSHSWNRQSSCSQLLVCVCVHVYERTYCRCNCASLKPFWGKKQKNIMRCCEKSKETNFQPFVSSCCRVARTPYRALTITGQVPPTDERKKETSSDLFGLTLFTLCLSDHFVPRACLVEPGDKILKHQLLGYRQVERN